MLLSKEFSNDSRVNKETKALVDSGHEITVVMWDRHGKNLIEEISNKVKVIRIRNNLLMKVLSNDLIRNPFWWMAAYKKGLELFKTKKFCFDVVHCHDLDTLPAGVLLKKKLNVKLVYDAHEIFGYMVLRDQTKLVSNFAFLLEKKLLRFIDHLIIAETNYLPYFKKVYYGNISSILNCENLLTDEYHSPKNDVFTLVYIGVLNKSRFFPNLIHVIGGIKGVKLVIAGKKENMFEEVQNLSKQFSNIQFLGQIPYSEVLHWTLSGDVVLCMINPVDINNKIATANKQFEAMVCGRPIICTNGTRSGDVTRQENCGLVIDYKDEALEEAVKKLRDSPDLCESLGRNALKAALNTYNWKNEEEKLQSLYNNILKV